MLLLLRVALIYGLFFIFILPRDHLALLPQTEAIDVDIDEILDMDTDDIRRSHLFVSILDCNY